MLLPECTPCVMTRHLNDISLVMQSSDKTQLSQIITHKTQLSLIITPLDFSWIKFVEYLVSLSLVDNGCLYIFSESEDESEKIIECGFYFG